MRYDEIREDVYSRMKALPNDLPGTGTPPAQGRLKARGTIRPLAVPRCASNEGI